MKLKPILFSVLLMNILIFKSQAQSELTIFSATANVNNAFAKCAYQATAGCPGWYGGIPMTGSEWITFDLGSIYKVTQLTFNQSATSGAHIYSVALQGSNDNATYTLISNASVVSGNNTMNLNCQYRYIRIAAFHYNNPPSTTDPSYFSNFKFYGSSTTTFQNLNVTGSVYANTIRAYTSSYYLEMGPLDNTYARFITNIPKFYFNKPIMVNGEISSYSTKDLILQTNGVTRISINNTTGNVGIGCTSTPESVKLAVNGKIQASEIEIKTTPCSDFVFEKNYKLMTIEELKNFVETNKHLPEIPSANEFKEKGGYDLTYMDDLLLRKVEQLTLYIIQLENKVKELEKSNGKK
jgi:hypothetical protein